jgi:hypothetical protein
VPTVRVLAEETSTDTVARLETYQQKPLRRLFKETVVAKSFVLEVSGEVRDIYMTLVG